MMTDDQDRDIAAIVQALETLPEAELDLAILCFGLVLSDIKENLS